MDFIKEIKQNKVHKDMLKIFNNKDILFLENGQSHQNCDGNLEIWLIENKIRYNSLYNISKLPLEYVKNQIEYYDIIAFQTTWTYEISKTLEEYISKLENRKVIVECYINEPSWNYKPKVIHDVYILNSFGDDMDDWTFDKLRTNKPYWEK